MALLVRGRLCEKPRLIYYGLNADPPRREKGLGLGLSAIEEQVRLVIEGAPNRRGEFKPELALSVEEVKQVFIRSVKELGDDPDMEEARDLHERCADEADTILEWLVDKGVLVRHFWTRPRCNRSLSPPDAELLEPRK